MMSDSASKRAEDSKSITQKTSMKAQLETELEASKEGKASSTKERRCQCAMSIQRVSRPDTNSQESCFNNRVKEHRDKYHCWGLRNNCL